MELFLKTQNINILFSEVEKLIRIYLTIPMSNATAERSFSALKRLKTYLRATMGQKRLNHLTFLHVHKDLTDNLDLNKILKTFVLINDRRK